MITGDHVSAKIGDMSPVLVPGVNRWAARGRVIRLNGQTAEHLGFSAPAAGTRSCEVQIRLVIDILAGDLVALEEGTIIQDLKLYAHVGSVSPIYHFDQFLVLEASPEGEMGGQFTYSISGENVGPFTFNDPSALDT